MTKLLIDGNHLSGRHHATKKDLCRSDGHLSGVIFGVIKGISYAGYNLKVPFEDMVVCWDGGRSKLRESIYPEYKNNRKWGRKDLTVAELKERADYLQQIKCLQENLIHLGIRQVRVPGMEADDLLGIFSKFYEDQNHYVIIYSGDFDLHQCASQKVAIFDPKREMLAKYQIEEMWKVPVQKIPNVKAITGDITDNIGGIKGLGEVRARKVLSCIEAKNYTPEMERWVELFFENYSIYKRNLRLVTIPRDWNTELYETEHQEEALEQLVKRPKRQGREFIHFLEMWELNSLLENINVLL